MKTAIFIGEESSVEYVYSNSVKAALADEVRFPYGSKVFSENELSDYDFSEINLLFSTWGMCELTEEQIHRFFPKLECVFYAAGSVQRFARPFLECGVKVISAWAANAVPVAEFTLAQIILASKGYFSRLLPPASGESMNRSWKKQTVQDFPGNYDITVGIIGAGMIGRLVIEKIHRVLEHIRILVFDPFLSGERAKELDVELCDLQTLFEQSDVISNHLANNAQTVGILNEGLFDRMKPFAVFINTGRGAQVVEKDLIKALKEVPTRAAALDVTFPEPPAEGSAFYQMRNVFLTPHMAGSLGNEVHRMGEYMLQECRRYLSAQNLCYEVTEKMLETMA